MIIDIKIINWVSGGTMDSTGARGGGGQAIMFGSHITTGEADVVGVVGEVTIGEIVEVVGATVVFGVAIIVGATIGHELF